jgi:hypothetical protein
MSESLPRCPKCQITLDIPGEFRGRVIRCLSCDASLRVSSATETLAVSLTAPPRGRYQPMIFVPMAALILFGSMGVLVNSYYAIAFRNNPESVVEYTKSTIAQMAASNFFAKVKADKLDGLDKLTDEEKEKRAEVMNQQAAAIAAGSRESLINTMWLFAGVGLIELLGGLAFAYGRFIWLAAFGCLAAIVNLNHGCCLPGAITGLWGLYTLVSQDGQRHFGRS